MTLETTNVVLLTNMITPYRIPLFRAISRVTGIRLSVLVETVRESNREWLVSYANLDFRFEILDGLHFPLSGVELHANPSIFSALHRASPDVVVIGGFSSITAWTSAGSTKLISISNCVNSACRSARPSSSRKQRAN